MTQSTVKLLLFSIAILCHSNANASVDPWTGIFREFALSTKETVQKFINQLGLGRFVQQQNGAVGLQTDPFPVPIPMAAQPPPACPLCRQYPPDLLTGRWQLSLWTRSFRLNTLSELDILIERTQAGLAFNPRRSFQELILDPPEPICPTFTVLDGSAESTKWELAYRMPSGRAKSIIGVWERLPFDGTILWRVGQLSLAQFCIALASWPTVVTNSSSSQPSAASNGELPMPAASSTAQNQSTSPTATGAFVLLNQVDGWPRCENFVALTRELDSVGVDQLRDLLERNHIGNGQNGLEKGQCL